MTDIDNVLHSTDLDAFKFSDTEFGSVTFSGTLAASAQLTVQTDLIPVSGGDFSQILFDNSVNHPGKYKDVSLEEPLTLVHESTRNSELSVELYLNIGSTGTIIGAIIFNPYNVPVSLDSTTLHFIIVPYQSTI